MSAVVMIKSKTYAVFTHPMNCFSHSFRPESLADTSVTSEAVYVMQDPTVAAKMKSVLADVRFLVISCIDLHVSLL